MPILGAMRLTPKLWYLQQEFVRENRAVQRQWVADSIRLTAQQQATIAS